MNAALAQGVAEKHVTIMTPYPRPVDGTTRYMR